MRERELEMGMEGGRVYNQIIHLQLTPIGDVWRLRQQGFARLDEPLQSKTNKKKKKKKKRSVCGMWVCVRMGDRERRTHRHRHTDTQTQKYTDKRTQTQTRRHTHTHTHLQVLGSFRHIHCASIAINKRREGKQRAFCLFGKMRQKKATATG